MSNEQFMIYAGLVVISLIVGFFGCLAWIAGNDVMTQHRARVAAEQAKVAASAAEDLDTLQRKINEMKFIVSGSDIIKAATLVAREAADALLPAEQRRTNWHWLDSSPALRELLESVRRFEMNGAQVKADKNAGNASL